MVEQFCEQLDSIIVKTPKKDVLVVQVDWNARVDPDALKHWAGTVGRFGIGEMNDRGWRLQELGKNHRLTLANALHPTSCQGQLPAMPLMGRFKTR